ncbi:hypothetical protein [Litorisediminicola beolgyonensis]|uniref:Chromosome partition protein Smc n=1 Tax=Litorisediminicola beolgyonensis TaxID=1173614 RepID=A0ABW3ZEV0_9RHOB
MLDDSEGSAKPTERLMQGWIYRETWTTEEALFLALGISPDQETVEYCLIAHAARLDRARRDGMDRATPLAWLWWGERNGFPYHHEWWLAVTPRGPIGYDGRHFAFHRKEMLSDAYLRFERQLITKWARMPSWTPQEALDISLNFEPFTSVNWLGEGPEFGPTIREREDRFKRLNRAVAIGEISETATPRDYIRWLDRAGYIVSEAWRRAVGLLEGNDVPDQALAMPSENEHLRRELEEKVAELEARSVREQAELKALSKENQALRHQLRDRAEDIDALRAEADVGAAKYQEAMKTLEELRESNEGLKADRDTRQKKAAQTRRIVSLQKALLAAVVDGFGYSPREGGSGIAQHISDAASSLGFSLTAQTITSHLKESADAHVSQDDWEHLYPRK